MHLSSWTKIPENSLHMCNSCMAAHQYFIKLQYFTTKKPHACKYTVLQVYPSCADVSVNTSSSCLLLTARTAFRFIYFSSWYPEIEHWLLVPCCPAAWEWSAGVRTAGHYSVFRCAASYQHGGLTEAAALVNTPAPERPPGGQDLTGLLNKLLGEKQKRERNTQHLPDSKCHALETAYDNPTSSPASRSQCRLLSAWRAWRRCLTGDSCRIRVTIFGHFKM